ncbi:hypothetical protein ACI2LD_09690 [Enterococcus casseliflavus]|uniref:hypothetical protein n=1 Tax=Enterococcus casseliflavus TaxID=37734 RepID=UPI0037AC17CF
MSKKKSSSLGDILKKRDFYGVEKSTPFLCPPVQLLFFAFLTDLGKEAATASLFFKKRDDKRTPCGS